MHTAIRGCLLHPCNPSCVELARQELEHLVEHRDTLVEIYSSLRLYTVRNIKADKKSYYLKVNRFEGSA